MSDTNKIVGMPVRTDPDLPPDEIIFESDMTSEGEIIGRMRSTLKITGWHRDNAGEFVIDNAELIRTEFRPSGQEQTDPREVSGGSISGPGGPYDVNQHVVDATKAVLLDGCEVVLLGGIRDGVLAPKPMYGLLLRGRINKTSDRADVLFLMNEDGAAGIVSELMGLTSRAGWGEEFKQNLEARLDKMPL